MRTRATDGAGRYVVAWQVTGKPEDTEELVSVVEPMGWVLGQEALVRGDVTLALPPLAWVAFTSDFGRPAGDPFVITNEEMYGRWRQVGG